MAREGNVIPFVLRRPKEPDVLSHDSFDRAFPEELFAYPHDPWFLEKILQRMREDRSS
jgi:hypothetical protein